MTANARGYVLFWLLITSMGIAALPSLASVTRDFTLAIILPPSAPSAQALNLAAPFENSRYAMATLLAVRSSGPLTAADQHEIDALEMRVKALPHVVGVQDLAVSPDGMARQALVLADVPQDGSGEAQPLVTGSREVIVMSQSAIPEGLTFHLTGPLALTADAITAQRASQGFLQILTLLFIVALLLLAFRSVRSPAQSRRWARPSHSQHSR